jgi:hypothetical protein
MSSVPIRFINKYRIYCSTEGISKYVWDFAGPTGCPSGVTHGVIPSSINQVASSPSVDFSTTTLGASAINAVAEFMVCDVFPGSLTINLPGPTGTSGFFRIKRVDSSFTLGNNLTINYNDGSTPGATTLSDKETLILGSYYDSTPGSEGWRWRSITPGNDVDSNNLTDYLLNKTTMQYIYQVNSYDKIGQIGPTGATGNSILNGVTSPPSNLFGKDGDGYLNTLTGEVYNKITGGWILAGSLLGATGATGATGVSFLSGTNPPAPTLGKDNDSYLNITTGEVSKKTGTWSVIGSLLGATGATGTTGPTGEAGTGYKCILRDIKSIGVPGGTGFTGGWTGRTINNIEESGDISYASLATVGDNMTFKLAPGIWSIDAQSVFYDIESARLRIYDINGATGIAYSTGFYTAQNLPSIISLSVSAITDVVVGATGEYSLEYRMSKFGADALENTDLGIALGNVDYMDEHYTIINLLKLK